MAIEGFGFLRKNLDHKFRSSVQVPVWAQDSGKPALANPNNIRRYIVGIAKDEPGSDDGRAGSYRRAASVQRARDRSASKLVIIMRVVGYIEFAIYYLVSLSI